MKFILALSLLLTLSACSGGGGGGSSNDPLVGNAYFIAFSAGSNYIIDVVKFESPNKFVARSGILYSNGNFLYQDSSGTFVRSSGVLTMNYTSRTCPGDSTVLYTISGNEGDYMTAREQGSSTSFNFWNDKKYTINGLTGTSIATYTEDTGCTLSP